jgi:hypothetical protein
MGGDDREVNGNGRAGGERRISTPVRRARVLATGQHEFVL